MFLCVRCKAPCQENHRFCPTCGHEINPDQAPEDAGDPFLGVTIGKKFVLRKLIGSGGMGNVYLAEQKRVGRTVAVKIMHRHLLEDERAVARFINEARAASQLNHPHSISVLDFGQTDAGLLYMVMEYLRGKSLDQVVEEEFPVPFGRIADILCQVMDAVEAAHRLNIIHRDLKPENVFLESTVGQDFVKVLDFGVAKILEREAGRTITTPGLVPGTPEYMSPEQARGWPLDARSDVYSLGVILYEMLTGTVPFKGGSALETMMSHVQDPPIPPSERRPDRNVPAALDSIVLWALAKEPSDRISSSAQFRDILSAWAEVSGIWPKKTETRERPVTEGASVLKEFFGDAVVTSEAPEVEQVAVVKRPQTRLKASAVNLVTQPGLMGRNQELARLKRFLAEPLGRVVRAVGPTGTGKSWLLAEAIKEARQAGMRVVHCQADTGWARISLAPVHRAIAAILGVAQTGFGDREEVRRAALELKMDPGDLPGLLDLVGIKDSLQNIGMEERQRERAVSFRNLVRCAAAAAPLVVVFELLDLYDQPSQDLVTFLVRDPGTAELKVMVSHDSSYGYSWPDGVARLELGPLAIRNLQQVAGALFSRKDASQIKRITDACGGNPLFLHQIAFAEVFEEISAPTDKIADLVAARVERLPQPEREALQVLAMVNTPMDSQTLSQIGDGPVSNDLLDVLVTKGFLLRQEDGLYAFVHRLLGLVIFSSIPAEVRRRQHQFVAEYLRGTGSPVTEVAFHSYEAEDGPHALEELERAGNWSVECLDFVGAVLWYSRAMEIVRKEWGKGRMEAVDLDDKAVDLAHCMAQALRETGDNITARGILEETLSVAAGKARSRAELRLELGRIYLDMGDLQRAVRHLKLASNDVEALSSREGRLKSNVNRQLARVQGLLGQRDVAGKLIMESLQETGEEGEGVQGQSWKALLESATICYQIGLPDRARGFLLDALQLADASGTKSGKLSVIIRMAEMHMNSKEWMMAEMRLSQALSLLGSKKVVNRTLEVKLMITVAWLQRVQKHPDKAHKLLEEAYLVARAIGYEEGMKRSRSEIEALKFSDEGQL